MANNSNLYERLNSSSIFEYLFSTVNQYSMIGIGLAIVVVLFLTYGIGWLVFAYAYPNSSIAFWMTQVEYLIVQDTKIYIIALAALCMHTSMPYL